MSNQPQAGNSKSIFALLVIPICLLISITFFLVVCGNTANFVEGDPSKDPIPTDVSALNHYLGLIYKGGFIVPIIITCLLTVIVFIIERFITIGKSRGTGNVQVFIRKVRSAMASGDTNAARAECAKQKGSIANVVQSGLHMYDQMGNDKEMDKERKLAAIQKEIEEATTLELPMLSKNLVILSTIASIATLLGLLGTVIGMIRAFGAMAQAGAPDASALSTGISEALVNTALGITTSAIAIIFYNYFTNRIDSITYGIDEAGYSIVQSFASKK